MSAAPPDLSDAPIDWDEFERLRRANLARWPTGAGVDLDEAVAFHKALPEHKRLSPIIRAAAAERRCLIQPRGGFGAFEMHRDLMRVLEQDGLADVLPASTDSYTRNERFENAAAGSERSRQEGRSLLNGYPIVTEGVARCREIIESVDRPSIVLSGTAMPRLTAEIALAAGYTGFLGSGIAYTVSYTKEVAIADGIRNYQYLDRLTALYGERGVTIHRRQPGFLTGTMIPPGIAIAIGVLDALLAARQGVREYAIELGQVLHLIQDAAALAVAPELCGHYLAHAGFPDVFTPAISLHWMGAWPEDEASAASLIAVGGFIAAAGGAVTVTTKSTHEAVGLPTSAANAEGARMARMGVYLSRGVRLDGLPAFEQEKHMIGREARAIVDKVLEMGDGDAAKGAVRAFEAGVLDVPWSPNRQVKSRIVAARDAEGYLRILEPGDVPVPADILNFHRERLREKALRSGLPFGIELGIESVQELTAPLSALLPPFQPRRA
jgi:methylaspartate mutase epsilon subunit